MRKAAGFLKNHYAKTEITSGIVEGVQAGYKEAALIPFAEVRLSLENEWVREMFLEGLGVSR